MLFTPRSGDCFVNNADMGLQLHNTVWACTTTQLAAGGLPLTLQAHTWISRTDTSSNLRIRTSKRWCLWGNDCRQGQQLKSAGYSNISRQAHRQKVLKHENTWFCQWLRFNEACRISPSFVFKILSVSFFLNWIFQANMDKISFWIMQHQVSSYL